MSKNHRIILTDEPEANVFVAGMGSNGRLGTGNAQSHTFFSPVATLVGERAIDVDVSDDHTVILTASNKIYTWGSNSFSALGYQADGGLQPTPKQVTLGDLKKGPDGKFLGVSCARFHTLAYTTNSIYVWGTNLGQLGFPSNSTTTNASTTRASFSTSTSLEVPVEQVPHNFHFKHGDIKQVAAIDHATIVLTTKDEIHAYLNGFHIRIQPPLLSKIDDTNFNAFRPRVLSRRKGILRLITQKASSVCLMLYDSGDISEFHIDTQVKTSAELAKMLRFSIVWKASKRHMRCTDVDLGNNGSVIICVEDGSAYKRTKRSRLKYSTNSLVSKRFKFSRIPTVNKVVRVVTDPLFEKFVFLRDEIDLLPHRLQKSSIYRDVARLSPLYELDGRHLQRRVIVDKQKKPFAIEQDTYLTDFIHITPEKVADSDREGDLEVEDEEPHFEDDDKLYQRFVSRWTELPHDSSKVRLPYKDTQNIEELLKSDDLEYWLELKDLTSSSKHYDTSVVVVDDEGNKEFSFGAHRQLLTCRAPMLEDVLNSGKVLDEHGIRVSSPGGTHLQISGAVTVRAVGILLHFLYTDRYYDVWTQFPIGKVPAGVQRTRLSFEALSRMIGVVSPMGRVQCVRPLLQDLTQILSGKQGDVEIQLLDGTLHAYKPFLCARSAYFETIFSDRWQEPSTSVTFDVSTALFQTVLRYLSGVAYDDLFADLELEDVPSFINFCLDLNELAGELLLEDLSDMCQLCIKDFITLDNFDIILQHAYDAGAWKLFDNCVWLVTNNLVLLLFDSKLAKLFGISDGLSKKLSEGIHWFHSLRKSKPGNDDEAALFLSSVPEARINEFLSNVKEFDAHFVHPLLWDAMGSFKEESDVSSRSQSSGGGSGRRRSSVRPKNNSVSSASAVPGSARAMTTEKRSNSTSLQANRSLSVGSDSINESAVTDDEDDHDDSEFVTVSHGRRSSSSARRSSSSASINSRPRFGSIPLTDTAGSGRHGSSGSLASVIAGSIAVPVSSIPLGSSPSGRRVSSSKLSGSPIVGTSSQWTRQATPPRQANVSLEDLLTSENGVPRQPQPQPHKFAGKGKLSQKERKKRQKEKENDKSAARAAPKAAPWTKSNTWQTVTPRSVTLDPNFSFDQVAPRSQPIPQPIASPAPTSAPTPALVGHSSWASDARVSVKTAPAPQQSITSFESVLLEEKLQKEMRENLQKVNLEDVQREQEFAAWWEEESRRVQRELRASQAVRPQREGGRGGGGGKKGRGRGHRGGHANNGRRRSAVPS